MIIYLRFWKNNVIASDNDWQILNVPTDKYDRSRS